MATAAAFPLLLVPAWVVVHLEKATKTEDVLTVFHERTNTRQQIEVLQGKMKFYEQSAALSEIDVNILATASIAPIEIAGWQPDPRFSPGNM